jgi:hypothetical protein
MVASLSNTTGLVCCAPAAFEARAQVANENVSVCFKDSAHMDCPPQALDRISPNEHAEFGLWLTSVNAQAAEWN